MNPVGHAPLKQTAPPFEKLYIFGAGGHGREIAWLSRNIWGDSIQLAFVVDKPEFLTSPVNGIPVRLLSNLHATPNCAFIAAIGDNQLRRSAAATFELNGIRAASLIHPSVELSNTNEIHHGVVICTGSILTTNIKIAAHTHINIGCTISHDVEIDEFSTLSPGVHVSGHVHIGKNVLIGTGASIINGRPNQPLIIGDGAVVAAGACVTKSVPPETIVAGVPATNKGPARKPPRYG